eukprot:CAMPEP_0115699576 /NCGR_PEP_ID=MMETSP0272-20121206/66952_1 /TAXON_ID=71861 /ORGANISM="Scrippsiella trochoidea, Strain CCMP3099" /LENGTH=56 /DNA_ID=CAMNT_0003140009 /DNA_START=242 /DNA_END=412 /DNA_ORIENTATION=+
MLEIAAAASSRTCTSSLRRSFTNWGIASATSILAVFPALLQAKFASARASYRELYL